MPLFTRTFTIAGDSRVQFFIRSTVRRIKHLRVVFMDSNRTIICRGSVRTLVIRRIVRCSHVVDANVCTCATSEGKKEKGAEGAKENTG